MRPEENPYLTSVTSRRILTKPTDRLSTDQRFGQLEVRDPEGKQVLWESLNITDLDWMVGVARKHVRPRFLRMHWQCG